MILDIVSQASSVSDAVGGLSVSDIHRYYDFYCAIYYCGFTVKKRMIGVFMWD